MEGTMRDTEVTTRVLYHPEKAFFLGEVNFHPARVYEARRISNTMRKLGFSANVQYIGREDERGKIPRHEAKAADILCQVRLTVETPDEAKKALYGLMERFHKLMIQDNSSRMGWIPVP